MSTPDGESCSRWCSRPPSGGPAPGHSGTAYCRPEGLAVARPRGGEVGTVVGQRRGVGVEELAVADGEVPGQVARSGIRVDLDADALATDVLVDGSRCRSEGLAHVLQLLDPDRAGAVDDVLAQGRTAGVERDPLVDAVRLRVLRD